MRSQTTAEWTSDAADRCKALWVQRGWGLAERERFSADVEQLATLAPMETGELAQVYVDLHGRHKLAKAQVEAKIHEAIAKLSSCLSDNPPLVDLVRQDALMIATLLDKMHDLDAMVLKLEVVGLNNCSRWHQDAYVGRAIVTYNGAGTKFLEDSNVDFDALKSKSQLGCVRDPAQMLQTQAGDVMLMRGRDSRAGGLIHRSPEPAFWPSGTVRNRLCLKIDVPPAGLGYTSVMN